MIVPVLLDLASIKYRLSVCCSSFSVALALPQANSPSFTYLVPHALVWHMDESRALRSSGSIYAGLRRRVAARKIGSEREAERDGEKYVRPSDIRSKGVPIPLAERSQQDVERRAWPTRSDQ